MSAAHLICLCRKGTNLAVSEGGRGLQRANLVKKSHFFMQQLLEVKGGLGKFPLSHISFSLFHTELQTQLVSIAIGNN